LGSTTEAKRKEKGRGSAASAKHLSRFGGIANPRLSAVGRAKTRFDPGAVWADIDRGSALAESRLHDVVAKATQANGGPNLFAAVSLGEISDAHLAPGRMRIPRRLP